MKVIKIDKMIAFNEGHKSVVSKMIENMGKYLDFCKHIECDDCPFSSRNNKFNEPCSSSSSMAIIGDIESFNDLFSDLLEIYSLGIYRNVKRFR